MTACRIDLLRAGYSPLPADGKKPVLASWPSKHDTNQGEIELWDKRYPDATNTGVLTKFTPAIDIDVTLLPAAEAIEKLAREGFEERGVILVRIGNPPKRAILLRTDEPFEKLSREFVAPDGSKHKIEALCDGQQVIVDGVHPETKQPYHWHGGSPLTVPREDLPCVTRCDVVAFLDKVTELLATEFRFTLAGKVRPASANDHAASCERVDRAALIGNIIAGRDLHDSSIRLAACHASDGMPDEASRRELQALFQASSAPRDKRFEERYTDIPRTVRTAQAKFGRKSAVPPTTPIDLWGKLETPGLPHGILPPVIEDFAFTQGELMGADPAGLAMGALVVCAAAIPDCVKVQVKEHDAFWLEAARLWVALVGEPSTKKSPILNIVAHPLKKIDGELARRYVAEKAKYDALSADHRKKVDPPKKRRLRIEDTTIEEHRKSSKTARTASCRCRTSFPAGSEQWTSTTAGAERKRIAVFGCRALAGVSM